MTDDDCVSLLRQHKKERDKRIADRLKVVLLIDDGWSFDEVSKALFLDVSTIRAHFEIYVQENRITPNHKGSEPRLSFEESTALTAHLTSQIYVKIKDIQAYVRVTFQKTLGISTLYAWLTRNGFTYRKPRIIPKKADPVKQEAFKILYHKIMNEAAIEGDTSYALLFAERMM